MALITFSKVLITYMYIYIKMSKMNQKKLKQHILNTNQKLAYEKESRVVTYSTLVQSISVLTRRAIVLENLPETA